MMIYAQRKLPSFWIVGLIDLLLVIAMVCVVIIPNLTNKLAILAGLISGVVTVILVPMTGVLSDSLSTYQAALNKCRAICNSITKSKFDEQHFLALVYGLGADEWGDFISKFDR
jgi:MFS-type transporter involved in bile tolerance (Atg22 family)